MRFPDKFRVQLAGYQSNDGDTYGVFIVPSGPDRLFCIATDGYYPGFTGPRWEHVSVTVRNRRGLPISRCPTWEQMHFIKTTFWSDSEAIMQLHPPAHDYVNFHPFCLHLWRPTEADIPLPPSYLVGPKT